MNIVQVFGVPIWSEGHEGFWSLVRDGKWEPNTFRIIDKYVNANTVFIDIGAWNGIFSIYAAKKRAWVIAAEPDPEAFGHLERNILINKVMVDIDRVAISDHGGIAPLNNMSSFFGDSMSSLVERDTVGVVTPVRTVTLERFIQSHMADYKRIGLIKMDIEGGEVNAIVGARRFLQEHRPNIHLSVHPAWIGEEGVRKILGVIIPIYDVNEKSFKIQGCQNLLDEIMNNHFHSFTLTRKK